MVRTITGDDLVSSSEEACDFDRVLVGFSTPVGEKEGINVTGCDFRKLGPQARPRLMRHERVSVGKRLYLFSDRRDHALIPVPNVHRHQLAIKVDEALSLWRPKVNTLGTRDRNWINLRLCRPFEQGMFLAQIDNFLTGHGGGYGCRC